MKILFLTNLYPPYVRGGAEFLASRVVEELKRQGYEVVVVTSVPWRSVRKIRPEVRDEGGVKVYRYFPLNFYHYASAAKYPWVVRFLWQIVNLWNIHTGRVVRRVIQKEKPDLAVSYNLMGLGFNIPHVLRVASVRHVHVLHDVQLLHPSGLFMWGRTSDSVAMKLYQRLTSRLFASVPIVASPSAWLLREHERRGLFQQSNRVVLTNPVPRSLAEPGIKGSHAPFTLLYVGQFVPHKGVYWLIETLKHSHRKDFALHVVTLGQKPQTKYLKELIDEDGRFVVHDLVNQGEVDRYLSESHLTIVPSLCYENSPTVIAQSLAAGTPVLAANLGGIPELIEEGVTGWLFGPGDSKEFMNKLSWCLVHPEAMLQAGLKGAKAISGRSIERYAQELVGLGQ